MKFGLLDFNKTVNTYWDTSWNQKALLNIGDAVEYMVVEQLYKNIGIDESKMVRLGIPELTTYRGESLIVALNIALDSYVGYNKILGEMSPDITPVFLGMSITSPNLTEKEISCLKNNAPVGCRDERTYEYVKSLGIPCYLNGCTASIVKIEAEPIPEIKDKIVFIDVPYGVKKYIPDELRKEIVFLNQEIYCRRTEKEDDFVPADWAENVLRYYNSKPKMIVTSRFHGAVLAIANDIPAIITLEKNTFRFSWLGNYYPIYTEDTFSEINWSIPQVDFFYERNLVSQIAQQRIKNVIQEKAALLELTDIQREKNTTSAIDSSNQVLYYRRVWEMIQKRWSKEKSYRYAFWGVNDNADELYSLISQHYPNAQLVDVYDLYKQISYKGIESKKPADIAEHMNDENFFAIVTAYLAARVAPDICEETKFPMDRVLLCERDFILVDDLVD